MLVSTAEFKKGLRIVFDGEPYTIVDFQHVKPGKGGAFIRTKLKHMRSGKVIDNDEVLALVDAIDTDTVAELCKTYFAPEKQTLVSLGPKAAA